MLQSAVVGVKSDNNESVVAFVQLSEGLYASDEELREFCKERLSPYKVPSTFVFLDTLPASGTGKILKASLSKMAQEAIS